MKFLKAFAPLLVVLILLLTSCSKEKGECVFDPQVSPLVDVEFIQLQDSIPELNTKEAFVNFFTRYPVVRDQLLGRGKNFPDDSVFINTLFKRFNHPGFDTLLLETKRVFGDLSTLKTEFQQAFTNIKYYYPDFVAPKVQTVITGLESDLVITDTLIVVGLDYYLGKEGRYRPKLYDYLLTRYEPEDIVPSCMLIYGISDRFNKTNLEDKTVLADMVTYGKSFYFAKHMLPCLPDSTLIWYSQEETEGARENERLIWARLIEDEVLYSKSHVAKQKFLGERPKTLEVGEKCPGRIGQWTGWQIVNKYMDSHADITLPQLMQKPNAEELFKDSHYKPI